MAELHHTGKEPITATLIAHRPIIRRTGVSGN
jgi:hypothetical protein